MLVYMILVTNGCWYQPSSSFCITAAGWAPPTSEAGQIFSDPNDGYVAAGGTRVRPGQTAVHWFAGWSDD